MIRLMKCRTDEWRPSFCLSWIPLDLNDRKTAMPKPRLSRELPQWNEIQPQKRGSSWRNRSHVPSSLDRQREWTRYFYELIARGTRRRFLQGEGLAKVRHQQRSPAVPVRLSPPYWDELARRGSVGGGCPSLFTMRKFRKTRREGAAGRWHCCSADRPPATPAPGGPSPSREGG